MNESVLATLSPMLLSSRTMIMRRIKGISTPTIICRPRKEKDSGPLRSWLMISHSSAFS